MLDILQKVFYRSNPAREAFVELCDDNYVQKMTFDSYLYKVRVRFCVLHADNAMPLCVRQRGRHPWQAVRACSRLTGALPRRTLPNSPVRALHYCLRLQTVVPGNPIDDVKLLVRTVSSLVRANALRQGKGPSVSFGARAAEEAAVA